MLLRTETILAKPYYATRLSPIPSMFYFVEICGILCALLGPSAQGRSANVSMQFLRDHRAIERVATGRDTTRTFPPRLGAKRFRAAPRFAQFARLAKPARFPRGLRLLPDLSSQVAVAWLTPLTLVGHCTYHLQSRVSPCSAPLRTLRN